MSDLSGFLSGLTQETLRIIGNALWDEEEEVRSVFALRQHLNPDGYEDLTPDERAFLIRSRGLRRLCDVISDEKGRAFYKNPYFKVWEREYARRFRVVRMDKVGE